MSQLFLTRGGRINNIFKNLEKPHQLNIQMLSTMQLKLLKYKVI